MVKKCFKCSQTKSIREFYRHPQMADKHLNKCKVCTRNDNKTSNGKIVRTCLECDTEFRTVITEIKRGGGLTCSRKCYYNRFRKIVKREEQSPNWKGDDVGVDALHQWVIRQLGQPSKCAKCGRTDRKNYDWANISREYKRDLSDWARLCRSCHIRYDRGHLNYEEFI